ncbi:MAG: hypothetical protein LBO62_03000, partial [Endomicrobium sp.]|nr:hypothetical protein [Endomicrobium sp.]
MTYGALTEEDRGAPEPNSKNLANLRKYIESIIAMERPIFGGATDVDSDRVGTLMYTDENKSPEVSGKLDNLPLAGLQGYGSNIKQKSDIVNSLAARQADVSKAIDESENNSPEVSDKSDNLSLSGLQGYGSNIKQKSDIVNSSIDENAKPEIKELTPNHIALIMAYAIAKSKGKGNFAANDVFVRTSPSTHLLDYFAALYGANTHPVNVGSKYIAEKINDAALNVQLGMESSGTILFKNWIYDKDGPMANILTYLIPIITGQSYSEILNEIYASAGYEFNFVEAKADLGKTEEEKAATKSAAVNFFKTASKEEIAKILPLLTLSDGTPAFPQGLELVSVNQSDGLYLGFRNAKTDEIRQKTGKPQQEGARDDIIWLQMRASGTENAVRIYAESYDETLTKQLVDLGQQIATQGGDRLNDIGEEKSYDKIKLEFNQAFELALDEPNKENVARLEDAAYNMSLYKTDDEQEQERIKRDIERAAIYLYGGIKLFLYSSEILERQLDEQPYEKSYLEKIYDDYLSAELLRSSSLVIAAKLYAVSYGYEFDAVTLGNIGFILNDITWFNFTIGRKNIAKVFDSIKEGDIEKTAQILINLCPPTVDEEQRQSRMQLGMKGFLDGSNKTGSSTLYSFSFLPLLAVFSQSDTFLGLNGTVWSAALSFAIIAAFFFGPMAVQKLLKSVRQRQGLTGLPEYKALKKHFKKLSKENIKKLRAGETAQDASVYRRELQGKNAKIAFDFSFN